MRIFEIGVGEVALAPAPPFMPCRDGWLRDRVKDIPTCRGTNFRLAPCEAWARAACGVVPPVPVLRPWRAPGVDSTGRWTTSPWPPPAPALN